MLGSEKWGKSLKKNIWIINHYASDTFFDEGGRHYWIAQYLKENQYEPIVFAANSIHGKGDYYFDDKALFSEHMAKKINVPYIFVRAKKYEGNGKQRIWNMIDFYRNVQKAAKRYAKENNLKPDVILASSVHPLAILAGLHLAKYFGVECICEIRDLWPESIVAYGLLNEKSILAKLLYEGERYLYKKADKIVMTWAGGYEYIVDKGWENEIPRSKVYHISNGVNLDAFNENSLRMKCEMINQYKEKIFVYTGSIREVNNLDMLVEAARLLMSERTDVLLLIFGDGDQRERLQEVVKQEGLTNIIFAGRVKKEEIPYILKKSYATILHNSSTRLDKYGQSQNKLFEYLAAGKPVLMTYAVGYSVVKKERCGWEIQYQNAREIATAIEEMSEMSYEEYTHMCDRAKKTASHYDFKNLTKLYIEIIEK